MLHVCRYVCVRMCVIACPHTVYECSCTCEINAHTILNDRKELQHLSQGVIHPKIGTKSERNEEGIC